jgi:hypothetical protein
VRLTRGSRGRREYALEGVGMLCVTGRSSRTATVLARGLTWQITRCGVLQPIIQVADAAGDIVGTFKGRTLRRGGPLAWSDRELALQAEGRCPTRYVLFNGDRRLATIEGERWDEQSVDIIDDERARIDPEVVLFAAFVVGTLAPSARRAT